MQKRPFLKALGTTLLASTVPGLVQAAGKPVRIGSTLSLTGVLGGTSKMHKIMGEIFIEQLNARGGLLGRPVEWILRDDQSKPANARTLYEQLITGDKVDLIMGPYATGNCLAAMGVAQRNQKVLITNSFGIPSLAKYDKHFSAYVTGDKPEVTFPGKLVDAIQASGANAKTAAVVTSKFPSVVFLSVGARKVFKERGLKEALWLEWEFGNRDFGPIAARLKEANADVVWLGTIGPESIMLLEAMNKIDYKPKIHFHLYPTPGPLAASPLADGALSVTSFEQHSPFTDNPKYTKTIKTWNDRAAAANLPDTAFDLQVANCYAGWEILEAGVKGSGSLEDAKIASWLQKNRVDTVLGNLRFDGVNNYGDDLLKVKQLQGGKWRVVHPKESAFPGIKMKV
jgi:ABC-type branched-subunit amino acid transport system substrate-binding protein